MSYWTPNEKEEFLRLFKKYGRNWHKLSELIPGKTSSQIKNYFQNYKVKLNLIAVLEEGAALNPDNPHLQVHYRRRRIGSRKSGDNTYDNTPPEGPPDGKDGGIKVHSRAFSCLVYHHQLLHQVLFSRTIAPACYSRSVGLLTLRVSLIRHGGDIG